MCTKRKADLSYDRLLCGQFGLWLRAGSRKVEWTGTKAGDMGSGGKQHEAQRTMIPADSQAQEGKQRISREVEVIREEVGKEGLVGVGQGLEGVGGMLTDDRLSIRDVERVDDALVGASREAGIASEVFLQEGGVAMNVEQQIEVSESSKAHQPVAETEGSQEEGMYQSIQQSLLECTNLVGTGREHLEEGHRQLNTGQWKRRV